MQFRIIVSDAELTRCAHYSHPEFTGACAAPATQVKNGAAKLGALRLGASQRMSRREFGEHGMSQQVTIKMPEELRRFAERAAADQDRSLSNWLRHLVAREARQA